MKKQSPSFEAEGTQPDYVRELLDAGRSDATRGYDVDAGLARHMAAVQAGAPVPPWANELVASSGKAAATAAAGAAAAKLATTKLVAGVALALATAGAIAAIAIGGPERTAPVAPNAAPAVPAVPVAPIAPPAAAPAPNDEANAESQAEGGEAVELDIAPITARAKREASQRQPSSYEPSQYERTAESDGKSASSRVSSAKSIEALIENVGKQPTRAASKGHVDLAPQSQAVARTEPEAESSERASNETAQKPAVAAPAPVVDDARLEREMGMLAVAQRMLKSDPERALNLARQGEKEFSGSMFTQERQQVLLLALIELGRIDEAKRLALPYLKRWPNGPFSDRLRTALAAAKPEN
jgi:DNA polymerase-3 subunit gamma/tau